MLLDRSDGNRRARRRRARKLATMLSLKPAVNGTKVKRPLILNVGLAKVGTSSLFRFLLCNGWFAAHDGGCSMPGRHRTSCATALTHYLTAQERSHPSVANMSFPKYAQVGGRLKQEAFTQLDDPYHCSFPQADRVDDLVQAFPSACFILLRRPAHGWAESVMSYNQGAGHGSLAQKMLGACRSKARRPSSRADLIPWCKLWGRSMCADDRRRRPQCNDVRARCAARR